MSNINTPPLDASILPSPLPGAARAGRAELAPGSLLDSYVVVRTISSGGSGAVYEARHAVIGRRAAIKVLHAELASSPDSLARFQREARLTNLIRHPNIVDLYAVGALPDGRPYSVMELLEGDDLGALLSRRGRFTSEEVAEMLDPVCSALDAAHALQVIHRDLKAGNVFLAHRDGKPVVKLLDFGIAKLLDPAGANSLTALGVRMGTPCAMAPEQLRGEPVDARTDVYALGVLLYHLLTGRFPFAGQTIQEIERSSLEMAPRPPSQLVPTTPAIDAVVLKCLEKDKERRFPSAGAVAKAFRAAVQAPNAFETEISSAIAMGVCFEVETQGEADDDGLLDDTARVLDAAEQALRDAGFSMALQTSTALVAVQLLPEQPDLGLQARRSLLSQVQQLAHALEERVNPHPQLRTSLRVHADLAEVIEGTDPPEITGGRLLNVAGWPPPIDLKGFSATAPVLANLEL